MQPKYTICIEWCKSQSMSQVLARRWGCLASSQGEARLLERRSLKGGRGTVLEVAGSESQTTMWWLQILSILKDQC